MKHDQGQLEQKSGDTAAPKNSHDLRNALAAVVNGVQVLRQAGASGPLAEQTLDIVERQLRRVVELMNELPGQSVEHSKNIPSPSAKHQNGRLSLLVVEDDRDVAKSLTSMLRLWGHEVNVAYDGLQALSAAKQNHPQVVLLDLDLPGLDGFEVARFLQQGSPKIKIVAVSAFDDQEHRHRVCEAGFFTHLVKPVAPKSLKDLLGTLTHSPV